MFEELSANADCNYENFESVLFQIIQDIIYRIIRKVLSELMLHIF